jgi:hypothetical protein
MKREDVEFIASACRGKLRFETFSAAQKAAKRSRHGRGDRTDEAYHCKFCSGFHVGTGTKPRHYGKRPKQEVDDEILGY